ncbi:MAG TPA: rhodanese-like domain-containing protein [Anaerolineales bacterium]|nr:rhodanese-like domain-containing protein [Anaerolineales bacterium]
MNRNDILIEADELLKKLGDKNIRIFDATITDDAYLQEHIPGAAFLEHENFSAPESANRYTTMLPEDKLAEQIGALGISNETEVVVYACGMLPYAVRAWWVLHYAGHDKVRILNGGLSAWKQAGGQTEKEIHSYEPANFQPSLRKWMYADKQEVLKSLKETDIAVVNVMPRESYDARHIKGSICLSSMNLMQQLDAFLPDDQLAAHLQEVTHNKRVITYCGGGIAATVNAVAHLMTGYEDVTVYHGSMFEWLAEDLPTVGDGKWEIWKK